MSSIAIDHRHHFTYGDYMTWPEDERWELIDGIAYNMTPAPTILHQRISRALMREIDKFLRGKTCEVLYAPVDVILPEKGESIEQCSNIVQPDLLVVCDPDKLDGPRCIGAPDFIIEILSPTTASKDQVQKTALYERHGVKEYWIIHPQDGLLTIRVLGDDGLYQRPRIVEFTGSVAAASVPGLEVDLDPIAELRSEAFPQPETRPSPSQKA